MKIEITATEEIIDNEEVTVWRIDKGDGIILINLNKIFDGNVSECHWLGNSYKFIEVMYHEWEGTELFAIVDTDGKIIRKGIRCIEEVLEKQGLFIVEMSGIGMQDEAMNFGLGWDDWKMAVINSYGNFVIPPEYGKVWFEDEENLFYVKNHCGTKCTFDLHGKYVGSIKS